METDGPTDRRTRQSESIIAPPNILWRGYNNEQNEKLCTSKLHNYHTGQQGWRNQLSVLSESYTCCSGQVNIFLLTCPWKSHKIWCESVKSPKNTFYFRQSCSRHPSWKRQASNYQSYSNFSNLQRWWGTLSHYYIMILSCLPVILTYIFATKICRWWIACLLNRRLMKDDHA